MSKRVYYDFRWFNSGGIGRFCREIGYSNSLNNCNFIEGSLSQALAIKDLVVSSKITLLGGYIISPGYNCPLLSFGRSIVTIHDLMHLNFIEYSNLKNKIYYKYIVRRAIKNAPLIFTVSDFTRHEISKWACIPLDKIFVIPNGVDHEFYHCDVEPIYRSRPYFFYVGNNKPHKNLLRLIEAYSSSGLYNTIDLVLSCNSNPLLDKLVNKLGLSHYVFFLSGVDEKELPSYYKGALATVLFSLYEGFGLPILESMAVGTPVITSNITAMPEVAGEAALLVDPYSVEAIQQAMVSLAHNEKERERLSVLGIERAKCFSWDKSRDLWDKALQPILEKL